jgi:hypothetical protein
LSSLRSNGSLYSVQVRVRFEGTPTKRVRRYIPACTRRNRALPKVLSTLCTMDKSTQSKDGAIGTSPPLSQLLPTLCTSAMQAPQMAPNNVLIGLLASLQVVDQKGRDGKRANGG